MTSDVLTAPRALSEGGLAGQGSCNLGAVFSKKPAAST